MKYAWLLLLLTSQAFAVTSSAPLSLATGTAVSLTDPTSVSLGTATNKTLINTHARLTTSSTGSATVVSHTVTAGKLFYVTGYEIEGYFPTPSSVAARLGDVVFVISGSTVGQHVLFNSTTSTLDKLFVSFPEPVPVPPGNAALISVTPASATSTAWVGNIYGYEK